ncbi:DUF6380 family protein [Streptomyces sp. NPDC056948]|uniref:DUF6380 family protein n=1 Tax=Streptomyces sp. NPDC056948 TaxID=3345975 RepID=UPI003640CE21
MTRERGQEESGGDEAHAGRGTRDGSDRTDLTARAPHTCWEARHGSDSIRASACGPRACREARPGSSTLRRPATRRGHDALFRHTVGDKRCATLRRVVASQTETAGPAPFSAHGRRAGEGAR